MTVAVIMTLTVAMDVVWLLGIWLWVISLKCVCVADYVKWIVLVEYSIKFLQLLLTHL